jgi:hypothetical protein
LLWLKHQQGRFVSSLKIYGFRLTVEEERILQDVEMVRMIVAKFGIGVG